MVIRCCHCGGALTYDIALGKMKCKYCDSVFEIADIKIAASEKDMMENNIFVCTACAAKLAVNDVESATYCAYCGQPTIVFERVSKMLKPDKILPFTITKDEAIKLIRKRFRSGIFIPKGFKNFKIERISGIYVPFWIYDINYCDNQTIRVNKGKKNYDHKVKAKVKFKGLTIDASSNLCNISSQKLEPFDLKELVKFDEPYLSGFYADCYHQTDADLSQKAFERCKKLFDRETTNSIAGFGTIIKSDPKWKIVKNSYAFLPAWFLTMRYKNKSYTMIVNGQTGKVIGAVPWVTRKVLGMFLVLTGVFTTFIPRLCTQLFLYNGDWVLAWEIVTILIYLIGYGLYKVLETDIGHTTSQKLKDFAENRQEENIS